MSKFKEKHSLIIILFFSIQISFAQKNESFLPNFLLGDELKNSNQIDDYKKYDFSNIWMKTENQFIYGIIGTDYQRIRIKLISIEKCADKPNEYTVFGKSSIKETICEFHGIIRITEIKELKRLHFGVDNEYEDKGIKSQGILIAAYEFQENKEQKNSGTFKGQLYSKWYVNSKAQIEYDDIEIISDGYFNNAFVGIWRSYQSAKEKICNWADYRVPNAKSGFDIGAGEFSVAEKYWNKGWLDVALKYQVPNDAVKSNKAEKKRMVGIMPLYKGPCA